MFVGHGLLAFAIVALYGHRVGWDREYILSVAVLAGAFATLPDVDIVYAPVGLLGGVSGVFSAAEAFWQTGNVVHRGITHSLVVAAVAALAFGLWTGARDWQRDPRGHWTHRERVIGSTALGLLAGLVAVATLVTGGLGGVIMTVFVTVGLAITTVAARRGIPARQVAIVALFGIASHPFGDLFTGSPPAFLYPLDVTLFAHRVGLSPDPTLNLIGAFLIELGTFWLATYAYCRLRDERVRTYVSPRAAVGLGYAGAVVLLPPPTLAASARFVFSALAVGFVGSVGVDPRPLADRESRFDGRTRSGFGRGYRTLVPRSRSITRADAPTAFVTGLAAVTLAICGYTLAYLLF
ncbi:MAG: metal-dependent hydrolase [Halorientalis sp.]